MLVIGSAGWFLEAFLGQSYVDANWTPNEEAALLLASTVRYDAILLSHPLPGLGLETYIAQLRQATGPNKGVPVVIALAGESDDYPPELESRDSIYPIPSGDAARLHALLGRIIGPAVREPLRLLAEVRLIAQGTELVTLCRTHNVSESGLFLSTTLRLQVGDRLSLGLRLDEDDLVDIAAVVVRIADEQKEERAGVGLRFTRFYGDGRPRLAASLVKSLADGTQQG